MKKIFLQIKFVFFPSLLRRGASRRGGDLIFDSRGLTFIELIVVAVIFSILAGISLFQFGSFSSSVSLQNVSQDIALRLVQAQKDGSSGSFPRLVTPLQGNLIPIPWTPAFGIHFSVPTGSSSTDFVSFFDGVFPINNKYDVDIPCSGGGECLDSISITSGDKIVGLCIETGNIVCTPSADGTFTQGSVQNIDIVFKRPNLAALISAYDGNGNDSLNGAVATVAKISIQSKNGQHYKIITVYPIGQITVD